MAANQGLDIEAIIFDYFNKFKFLFYPDQWNAMFLDYTKNEILSLVFIYRNKSANMTEISEYINAPLNTTTGIISRLEKKSMVERRRGNEDRRIVNIVLTKTAEEYIEQVKEYIGYYINEIYKVLTEEEKAYGISIFNKVISVLNQKKSGSDKEAKKVKRIIIE